MEHYTTIHKHLRASRYIWCSSVDHAHHSSPQQDLLRTKRQPSHVLIEDGSIVKHSIHICDTGCIPSPERHIERCGSVKHKAHIFDICNVPLADVFIEMRHVSKEFAHVGDLVGSAARAVALQLYIINIYRL